MSRRDWNTPNALIIAEFRANQGRVGGYFADKPLLLLTSTGARSGKQRTNPLGYLYDAGRYVVFASVVGDPRNPDWYYNLRANPQVLVEVGTDSFPATAEEATGTEYQRLFDRHATAHPQWAQYQTRTSRPIPVIILTPSSSDSWRGLVNPRS
jgi:deazaflavin-dependent oxidoreductase (nitroreductase family)